MLSIRFYTYFHTWRRHLILFISLLLLLLPCMDFEEFYIFVYFVFRLVVFIIYDFG